MPTDEPTLGELMRRIVEMQASIEKLTERVENSYVRNSTLEPLERRISALESSQSWAVKIVLGVVITALLGLVIIQGGAIH